MDEKPLSPEELQQLVRYAGQRLGMTPQQLTDALNSGGTDAVAAHLSQQETDKLAALLSDPAKSRRLMAMPEVQQLIRSLLKGG